MARGAGRAPVWRPLVKPESDRGTATQPRSWRPERGARLRAAPLRLEAPGDRVMRSPEQTVKRTIRTGGPQPAIRQVLEFLQRSRGAPIEKAQNRGRSQGSEQERDRGRKGHFGR